MKEIDEVDKKFGHTTITIYYLINANYKFNCQQISYLLNMKKKKATTKEKGKKKIAKPVSLQILHFHYSPIFFQPISLVSLKIVLSLIVSSSHLPTIHSGRKKC